MGWLHSAAIAPACLCLFLLLLQACSYPAYALGNPTTLNRRLLGPSDSSTNSRQLLRQQGVSTASKLSQGGSSSSSSCALLTAVRSEGQLKVLSDLLTSTGLAQDLCCSNKQLILLAPSNAALNAYLAHKKMTLNMLTQRKAMVRSALKYHSIPDLRLKGLLLSGSSSSPQSLMVQTASNSAPSELKVDVAGGSVTITDARGHTAKVLQQIMPPGASSPTLLVIDRVLSRGTSKGPSMTSVYTVEESGAVRINGKASLAHADGAVGSSKAEISGLLQRQP